MTSLRKLAASGLGLAVAAGVTLPLSAHASSWNQHVGMSNLCSLSKPNQYMLQHNTLISGVVPGKTRFTATHGPGPAWQDAYWTTGYGHSIASTACNGHNGPYGQRKSLPILTHIGTPYYGTLNESRHNFSGLQGWDIWLDPRGTGTSNHAMGAGGWADTELEIVLGVKHPWGSARIAGHKWGISEAYLPAGYEGSQGGWHRLFYMMNSRSQSVSNLNISAIVRDAVIHHHVPKSDLYYAIDAGGELTQGSFTVSSYQLSNRSLATPARHHHAVKHHSKHHRR